MHPGSGWLFLLLLAQEPNPVAATAGAPSRWFVCRPSRRPDIAWPSSQLGWPGSPGAGNILLSCLRFRQRSNSLGVLACAPDQFREFADSEGLPNVVPGLLDAERVQRPATSVCGGYDYLDIVSHPAELLQDFPS